MGGNFYPPTSPLSSSSSLEESSSSKRFEPRVLSFLLLFFFFLCSAASGTGFVSFNLIPISGFFDSNFRCSVSGVPKSKTSLPAIWSTTFSSCGAKPGDVIFNLGMGDWDSIKRGESWACLGDKNGSFGDFCCKFGDVSLALGDFCCDLVENRWSTGDKSCDLGDFWKCLGDFCNSLGDFWSCFGDFCCFWTFFFRQINRCIFNEASDLNRSLQNSHLSSWKMKSTFYIVNWIGFSSSEVANM